MHLLKWCLSGKLSTPGSCEAGRETLPHLCPWLKTSRISAGERRNRHPESDLASRCGPRAGQPFGLLSGAAGRCHGPANPPRSPCGPREGRAERGPIPSSADKEASGAEAATLTAVSEPSVPLWLSRRPAVLLLLLLLNRHPLQTAHFVSPGWCPLRGEARKSWRRRGGLPQPRSLQIPGGGSPADISRPSALSPSALRGLFNLYLFLAK